MHLAQHYFDQRDYAAARPLYERALAIRERFLGPNHPSTALTLNNLALLLHKQKAYADARPLYERALEICKRVLGRIIPIPRPFKPILRSSTTTCTLTKSESTDEPTGKRIRLRLQVCAIGSCERIHASACLCDQGALISKICVTSSRSYCDLCRELLSAW